MKNTIFFAAFLLTNLIAFAQDNVPEVVRNAFQTKFPKAENAKYIAEKNGNFEVEYSVNSKTNSAVFSKKGVWLESEEQISYNDTPIRVQDYIAINYVRYAVKSTEKVSTPSKVFYEIVVKKGNKSYELSLDAKGKLLKKE